ncbi:hypothetical protein N7488_010161 [Penicillium malachiteum]|nr:hypothetical protein N7488_010161 [Penicillium malachiteum]
MSRNASQGSTTSASGSTPRSQVRVKRRITHTKSRNGCLTCKSRRVKDSVMKNNQSVVPAPFGEMNAFFRVHVLHVFRQEDIPVPASRHYLMVELIQ